MKNINIKDVKDLEIDGVDSKDYPDFCDSFFSRAIWIDTGEELTDDELELLQDTYPELLNEMAYNHFM